MCSLNSARTIYKQESLPPRLTAFHDKTYSFGKKFLLDQTLKVEWVLCYLSAHLPGCAFTDRVLEETDGAYRDTHEGSRTEQCRVPRTHRGATYGQGMSL